MVVILALCIYGLILVSQLIVKYSYMMEKGIRDTTFDDDKPDKILTSMYGDEETEEIMDSDPFDVEKMELIEDINNLKKNSSLVNYP